MPNYNSSSCSGTPSSRSRQILARAARVLERLEYALDKKERIEKMISRSQTSELDKGVSPKTVLNYPDYPVNSQSAVVPRRLNKAHTATAHRLARRFSTTYDESGEFDIQTESLTVEVETTATISSALDRLGNQLGPVYVAVTNREGIYEALRLTEGTRVGVMDPQGDIVRESLPVV